ncbi:CAP domain-containing protein, partial [Xanthomonas oryzae pv. oryzae]
MRRRAPTECDLHFKVELPALFRPAMRPIFARLAIAILPAALPAAAR